MPLIWLQVFSAAGNDAFSCSIAEDLSSFGCAFFLSPCVYHKTGYVTHAPHIDVFNK